MAGALRTRAAAALVALVAGLVLTSCGLNQSLDPINEVFAAVDPASLGTVLFDRSNHNLDAANREVVVAVSGTPQEVRDELHGRLLALGYRGSPLADTDIPGEAAGAEEWSVGDGQELKVVYFGFGSELDSLFLGDPQDFDPVPAGTTYVKLGMYE